MIFGLTGGIGSGKSTVSRKFAELGAEVFDADIIAKSILESDEIKKEIDEKIENGILNKESNIIDKKRLRKIVFENRDKLEILNQIIHPKVKKRFCEIAKKVKDERKMIIFDVPLLFESGLDKICDKVIVVDVDEEIQKKRVMARDSIGVKDVENIISNQMKREERNKRADIVLRNDGDLEELDKKIKSLYCEIMKG